jgi:hypothetical protein
LGSTENDGSNVFVDWVKKNQIKAVTTFNIFIYIKKKKPIEFFNKVFLIFLLILLMGCVGEDIGTRDMHRYMCAGLCLLYIISKKPWLSDSSRTCCGVFPWVCYI